MHNNKVYKYMHSKNTSTTKVDLKPNIIHCSKLKTTLGIKDMQQVHSNCSRGKRIQAVLPELGLSSRGGQPKSR